MEKELQKASMQWALELKHLQRPLLDREKDTHQGISIESLITFLKEHNNVRTNTH